MSILKEVGLDGKDLRILGNMYWNRTACLKLDEDITDDAKILRGVRQGCILSPLIFNLYSEKIFKEALNGIEEDIQLNRARINNIKYAEGTVILADNIAGLQTLMDHIAQNSHQLGLNINV